jgi:hypothetical protein
MRMWYQPLNVLERKTVSEMAAGYISARKRLRTIPAQPVVLRPSPDQPRHLASILTLEAVEPPKISAQEIIAAVAVAHGVNVGDMKGPRRWMTFVNARHHAVFVIAKLRPDLSLPLIGRILNRDHTTVLNAKRRWPRVAGKFTRQHSAVCDALGISPDCG